MTEILIISHSSEIAQGTRALVSQMAGDTIIHASGGVDGGIGTNIDQINDMIGKIGSDTICFYDIGSSRMNLEMAVEMYDGEHKLHISEAPIVEGAFLAAVENSVGSSTEAILEKLDTMKK
ncbi:dihydroxyacetone kinase phosphoryl donor subunit DhaM [Salinicoccus roseus]|uniref:phosphoenolpyruvate--glycerone phosphotransferase n=1 Tax=Salinicoccus roseus TaxID=45670 RepID=A0A265E4F0_9STAP|nr:dihydroxyacetone kinase phosphoryl donor subunit DhaM [Salinicoccus roseus]OZT76464.1 PTS mannose transporter subunit IIA [Salinicoccus roseus]RPE51078.1 dihydroxyacetone kinase DhaM subunit [Salinicoccus roseus]GGA78172.1 PTS-dependent dihydroxyacetone kinase phosphotransferase subunit DhaM [Salinicoccus roseus]